MKGLPTTMTANTATTAPLALSRVPRQRRLHESRREREFYKYFEPIQKLTEQGPQLCDMNDEKAVKAHQPCSSPDRALTAFCQLGAMRLACRRAMLFFFDSNYAYVLAEATRTLSLVDDTVHDIDDSLWLGHSVIPRGYSICEETVCALPNDDALDPQEDVNLIHVINDIDQDTQFCDRPYVTDGPKAKFYAGVPITTPKGIKIGAFCCLDDRKRDGLSDKEMNFMQDMAKTVMTHLEMVRAKSEHERGTQMVCGLSAFVEGASSLQRWEEDTACRDYRRVGGAAAPALPHRPPLSRQLSAPQPSTETYSADSSATPSSANSSDSVPTIDSTASQTQPTSPAESSTAPLPPTRISRQATEDLRDQLVATNIRDTFRRAANLVQEAVAVDGVVFLDASPGTYGGLIETHDGSEQSSDAAMSSTTDAGSTDHEPRRRASGKSPEKPCRVLAASHTEQDVFNDRGEIQADCAANNITEPFLRSLLRRNPRGKIWNFNEDGDASSDDSSSDGGGGRTASHSPESSSDKGSEELGARRKRRSRIDDGREIQRSFPGVRSLALIGMWDQNRSRWFSACAIWTYSPMRLLSPESEVNYLSAFCDVIMAEIHRQEAQNADKAKADFISSISHELRSPLHGILGSVECLQEQPGTEADSFNSGLVSQIEVCGRTLLDIVDHLLDFSKINHHTRKRPHADDPPSARSRRVTSPDNNRPQLGNLMSPDMDCPLDEVTEEVVETAVYSFGCSRAKEFMLERNVTVTLDIDRSVDLSWRSKMPIGGWKRICINLVSNALKYTSEGYIQVSLKAEPIPERKRKFNAVFRVADSGRGMSKDFLQNHLFRAFSQEDSLVEGTGLGMSLVAKIVRAMGGRIEVQSEKGAGTIMTVIVPVDLGRSAKDLQATQARQNAQTQFCGSSFALLRSTETPPKDGSSALEMARHMLHLNLATNCKQLGLTVALDQAAADILIMTEQDLDDGLRPDEQAATDKPFIIVCKSAVSVRPMRTQPTAVGITSNRIEYIAQPCGTARLTKAIKHCLGENPGAPLLSTVGEDHATTGATSSIADRPARPHEHDAIGKHLLQVPSRDDGLPKAEELDTMLYNPPSSSPVSSEKASPSIGLLTPFPGFDQEADDYLSARSKSAGATPASPSAVTPVSPKGPIVRTSACGRTDSGLSLLLVDDNASRSPSCNS